MNDISSKTLLLLLFLCTLTMFSCSTSSKSYTDYTKNRSYKPASKKGRTYTHAPSHKSKKSTHKSKTRSTSKVKAPKKITTSVSSERLHLVEYAKTLEGINYIYGGKSEMGFDCSGFTSYVYTKQGKKLVGNSNSQSIQGKRIPISQARIGDLIFFGSTQKISHVAIVVENSNEKLVVVHASSSKGVVTQNIKNSPYWTPKMLYAVDVLHNEIVTRKSGYSK